MKNSGRITARKFSELDDLQKKIYENAYDEKDRILWVLEKERGTDDQSREDITRMVIVRDRILDSMDAPDTYELHNMTTTFDNAVVLGNTRLKTSGLVEALQSAARYLSGDKSMLDMDDEEWEIRKENGRRLDLGIGGDIWENDNVYACLDKETWVTRVNVGGKSAEVRIENYMNFGKEDEFLGTGEWRSAVKINGLEFSIAGFKGETPREDMIDIHVRSHRNLDRNMRGSAIKSLDETKFREYGVMKSFSREDVTDKGLQERRAMIWRGIGELIEDNPELRREIAWGDGQRVRDESLLAKTLNESEFGGFEIISGSAASAIMDAAEKVGYKLDFDEAVPGGHIGRLCAAMEADSSLDDFREEIENLSARVKNNLREIREADEELAVLKSAYENGAADEKSLEKMNYEIAVKADEIDSLREQIKEEDENHIFKNIPDFDAKDSARPIRTEEELVSAAREAEEMDVPGDVAYDIISLTAEDEGVDNGSSLKIVCKDGKIWGYNAETYGSFAEAERAGGAYETEIMSLAEDAATHIRETVLPLVEDSEARESLEKSAERLAEFAADTKRIKIMNRLFGRGYRSAADVIAKDMEYWGEPRKDMSEKERKELAFRTMAAEDFQTAVNHSDLVPDSLKNDDYTEDELHTEFMDELFSGKYKTLEEAINDFKEKGLKEKNSETIGSEKTMEKINEKNNRQVTAEEFADFLNSANRNKSMTKIREDEAKLILDWNSPHQIIEIKDGGLYETNVENGNSHRTEPEWIIKRAAREMASRIRDGVPQGGEKPDAFSADKANLAALKEMQREFVGKNQFLTKSGIKGTFVSPAFSVPGLYMEIWLDLPENHPALDDKTWNDLKKGNPESRFDFATYADFSDGDLSFRKIEDITIRDHDEGDNIPLAEPFRKYFGPDELAEIISEAKERFYQQAEKDMNPFRSQMDFNSQNVAMLNEMLGKNLRIEPTKENIEIVDNIIHSFESGGQNLYMLGTDGYRRSKEILVMHNAWMEDEEIENKPKTATERWENSYIRPYDMSDSEYSSYQTLDPEDFFERALDSDFVKEKEIISGWLAEYRKNSYVDRINTFFADTLKKIKRKPFENFDELVKWDEAQYGTYDGTEKEKIEKSAVTAAATLLQEAINRDDTGLVPENLKNMDYGEGDLSPLSAKLILRGAERNLEEAIKSQLSINEKDLADEKTSDVYGKTAELFRGMLRTLEAECGVRSIDDDGGKSWKKYEKEHPAEAKNLLETLDAFAESYRKNPEDELLKRYFDYETESRLVAFYHDASEYGLDMKTDEWDLTGNPFSEMARMTYEWHDTGYSTMLYDYEKYLAKNFKKTEPGLIPEKVMEQLASAHKAWKKDESGQTGIKYEMDAIKRIEKQWLKNLDAHEKNAELERLNAAWNTDFKTIEAFERYQTLLTGGEIPSEPVSSVCDHIDNDDREEIEELLSMKNRGEVNIDKDGISKIMMYALTRDDSRTFHAVADNISEEERKAALEERLQNAINDFWADKVRDDLSSGYNRPSDFALAGMLDAADTAGVEYTLPETLKNFERACRAGDLSILEMEEVKPTPSAVYEHSRYSKAPAEQLAKEMNRGSVPGAPKVTPEQAEIILRYTGHEDYIIYKSSVDGELCIYDASEDFDGEGSVEHVKGIVEMAAEMVKKAYDNDWIENPDDPALLKPLFDHYIKDDKYLKEVYDALEETNIASNKKIRQRHTKDGNGLETWREYDENGNETHFRISDGYEEWHEYNAVGYETHYKDSRGFEKWREYNADGNMVHFWNSNGYEEWHEYDADGKIVHSRDSNNYETWREFDENGNETHYKDSNGDELWREYNANGNMVHSKGSGDYEEWCEYNTDGNMVHSKGSGDYEEWREYDTDGNMVHHKNSDGIEQWLEYNKKGKIVHSIDSNGYETWREYDADGRQTHYKDSDGYKEIREYDDNGNLLHYKDSGGYEEWREYDENGNEVHHKDSDGIEEWTDYVLEGETRDLLKSADKDAAVSEKNLKLAEKHAEDLDRVKFFVDRKNRTVLQQYYNPDAISGGQIVEVLSSFDELKDAVRALAKSGNFGDFDTELEGISGSAELTDVYMENFAEKLESFHATEGDMEMSVYDDEKSRLADLDALIQQCGLEKELASELAAMREINTEKQDRKHGGAEIGKDIGAVAIDYLLRNDGGKMEAWKKRWIQKFIVETTMGNESQRQDFEDYLREEKEIDTSDMSDAEIEAMLRRDVSGRMDDKEWLKMRLEDLTDLGLHGFEADRVVAALDDIIPDAEYLRAFMVGINEKEGGVLDINLSEKVLELNKKDTEARIREKNDRVKFVINREAGTIEHWYFDDADTVEIPSVSVVENSFGDFEKAMEEKEPWAVLDTLDSLSKNIVTVERNEPGYLDKIREYAKEDEDCPEFIYRSGNEGEMKEMKKAFEKISGIIDPQKKDGMSSQECAEKIAEFLGRNEDDVKKSFDEFVSDREWDRDESAKDQAAEFLAGELRLALGKQANDRDTNCDLLNEARQCAYEVLDMERFSRGETLRLLQNYAELKGIADVDRSLVRFSIDCENERLVHIYYEGNRIVRVENTMDDLAAVLKNDPQGKGFITSLGKIGVTASAEMGAAEYSAIEEQYSMLPVSSFEQGKEDVWDYSAESKQKFINELAELAAAAAMNLGEDAIWDTRLTLERFAERNLDPGEDAAEKKLFFALKEKRAVRQMYFDPRGNSGGRIIVNDCPFSVLAAASTDAVRTERKFSEILMDTWNGTEKKIYEKGTGEYAAAKKVLESGVMGEEKIAPCATLLSAAGKGREKEAMKSILSAADRTLNALADEKLSDPLTEIVRKAVEGDDRQFYIWSERNLVKNALRIAQNEKADEKNCAADIQIRTDDTIDATVYPNTDTGAFEELTGEKLDLWLEERGMTLDELDDRIDVHIREDKSTAIYSVPDGAGGYTMTNVSEKVFRPGSPYLAAIAKELGEIQIPGWRKKNERKVEDVKALMKMAYVKTRQADYTGMHGEWTVKKSDDVNFTLKHSGQPVFAVRDNDVYVNSDKLGELGVSARQMLAAVRDVLHDDVDAKVPLCGIKKQDGEIAPGETPVFGDVKSLLASELKARAVSAARGFDMSAKEKKLSAPQKTESREL